jgi:hypothetical protein
MMHLPHPQNECPNDIQLRLLTPTPSHLIMRPASFPLIFEIGPKNECALLSNQLTHFNSSTLGFPYSVLDLVRRAACILC